MLHAPPVTLVQKLVQRADEQALNVTSDCAQIPVTRYTDQAYFDCEQARLFKRRPLIVAHESQLPEPGDTLVYDWLGLPLITIRDKRGDIGTFINVCRHRGMRLVEGQGNTCLRSLVCPYHQWTYGLDGQLRNIPRRESFPGTDASKMSLVALPTTVRNGLVWVQLDRAAGADIDWHLSGLDTELDVFRMQDYTFFTQNTRTIQCNWKLIQDAFLDGYHVVRLHKNTVGPFFPDAISESDCIGDHIRSTVARNEIAEAVALDPGQLDLRRHCTFSYSVFPNAVLIFHPDYTSIISLFPQSPDETIFSHTMLTPHAPTSEQEKAHFQRSFELIDQGVFQAEDIHVSEGAQRGMRSGANSHLLFGALEGAAIQFHEIVERELAAGNSDRRHSG